MACWSHVTFDPFLPSVPEPRQPHHLHCTETVQCQRTELPTAAVYDLCCECKNICMYNWGEPYTDHAAMSSHTCIALFPGSSPAFVTPPPPSLPLLLSPSSLFSLFSSIYFFSSCMLLLTSSLHSCPCRCLLPILLVLGLLHKT